VDAAGTSPQLRLVVVLFGMRIEDIAHLVGHASTAVTEKVYRKELRPVLRAGATARNTLFDSPET
jgi:hypothetical protein